MVWFQRLFPALMLLWPALCAQLLRPRRAASGAGGLLVVWLATAAFLLVHGVVQFWLERAQPMGSRLRIGYPIFMAVLGGSVLWFGFALRALAEMRPGLTASEPRPEGDLRTASLVARHRQNPVPPVAWVIGWAVFVLSVGAMVWAMTRGAPVGLIAGTAFWLFSGPLAARMSLTEPEPLDRYGSRELTEAYERMRSFKVWVFYWMGLTGTLVFAMVTVVMAVRPEIGGWLGAIFGTSLGIAGGIVGMMGGIRRARIVELRHRLANGQQP